MSEPLSSSMHEQDRVPAHRRSITVEVIDYPEYFLAEAHLVDQRPWARGSEQVEIVHDLTLRVKVDRASMVIIEAKASMDKFPHAECPQIAPSFESLVGISVAQGYNKAIQDRFGRVRGCAHLVVLASAIAPTVIQAIPSAFTREANSAEISASFSGSPSWLTGTCHVWAPDGPGAQKIALGWRPGSAEYPAPLVETVARQREDSAGD